jgi:hypothetical protein
MMFMLGLIGTKTCFGDEGELYNLSTEDGGYTSPQA